MKKYFVYLKINDEKTGDYMISPSRKLAAQYFASKKHINLKDWLQIYKLSK